MNRIEIIMLGNRGSGKTTLLATMANELSMNEKKFDTLRLEPQGDEFKVLNRRWSDQLKQLETEISYTGEYAGTADIIEHKFEFTNDKETLTCYFVDTPGGQTYDSDASLKQRVNDATALICIVDAVSLMESPSVEAARNECAVSGIKELLRYVTKKSCTSCLFVLTKCEKYTHSRIPSENIDALAERFTECFAPVLKLKNLKSYYLPVETLGCLEFACFEGKGENRQRKWLRTAINPEPVNTLVPLCFAMIKMLNDLKDQKSWWEKVFEWLFESEEYEKHLKNLFKLISKAEWFKLYNPETNSLKRVQIEDMQNDE